MALAKLTEPGPFAARTVALGEDLGVRSGDRVLIAMRDRPEFVTAFWGAMNGAGGAIGVLLSGVITQYASWRWVLLINVPIAAVTLLVRMLYLVPVVARLRRESDQAERQAGRLDKMIARFDPATLEQVPARRRAQLCGHGQRDR